MTRLVRRGRRLAQILPLLFLLGGAGVSACTGSEPTGPTDGCCKICRTGKACGDTCIAKDRTCNVGDGCACNG